MSLNGNLKVGQSEDFVLKRKDGETEVSLPASVSYAVEPSAVGTVTPKDGGGTFKALAKGNYKITVTDAEGDTPGTLSGVVSDPLALALAWV